MSGDTSDAEEELIVYAAFDDKVEVDQYRSIHVLGISESNPIIQMDDTFFTGNFDSALGTYMFFEEDLSPHSFDPLLDKLPEKTLKYVSKTRKLLDMKQAFVTNKEEQEIPHQVSQQDNDIEAVGFKNIEEALAKFREEFKLEESKLEHQSASPATISESVMDAVNN